MDQARAVFLAALMALALLVVTSSAVSVAASPSALSDGRYSVVFKAEVAPSALVAAAASGDRRAMRMRLQNGTEYLCALPAASHEEATAAKEEAETSAASMMGAPVPPLEALLLHAAMKGQCAIKATGWWIYEMCWARRLREYHVNQATNEVEVENILGSTPEPVVTATPQGAKYGAKRATDGAAEPAPLAFGYHPVNGLYVMTTYTHGSLCPISRQPRQSEIRLHCLDSPTDDGAAKTAFDVAEPETCRYVVTWWHKAACHVRRLRPADSAAEEVPCYVAPALSVPAVEGGNSVPALSECGGTADSGPRSHPILPRREGE